MFESKDVISLYFNEEENVFTDEDGFIVWSIFELITPNDLFLFRKHRDYMTVRHRSLKNVQVELCWPDEDEWDGNPDTVCDYCNANNYPLCDLLE